MSSAGDAMPSIKLRLDPDLKRALQVRAFSLGVSMSHLVVAAIERTLTAGGLARSVRVHLESNNLLEVMPGRGGDLDLEIGEALAGATSHRARAAAVAGLLERSPAVVEVYGTEPDLRAAIRFALG